MMDYKINYKLAFDMNETLLNGCMNFLNNIKEVIVDENKNLDYVSCICMEYTKIKLCVEEINNNNEKFKQKFPQLKDNLFDTGLDILSICKNVINNGVNIIENNNVTEKEFNELKKSIQLNKLQELINKLINFNQLINTLITC